MNLNTARILCLSRAVHAKLVLRAATRPVEVESVYRCLQEHFIGLAYKLLLTLPVSQVTYEYKRPSSALRRIKSRLRSTVA